jgi:hypothetical protein
MTSIIPSLGNKWTLWLVFLRQGIVVITPIGGVQRCLPPGLVFAGNHKKIKAFIFSLAFPFWSDEKSRDHENLPIPFPVDMQKYCQSAGTAGVAYRLRGVAGKGGAEDKTGC